MIIAVAADVSHYINRDNQTNNNSVRGSVRQQGHSTYGRLQQTTSNKAQYHQNHQYRSNPFANNPFRGKNRYQNRQSLLKPATSEQPPYNYEEPTEGYLPPDNSYLPPNKVSFDF